MLDIIAAITLGGLAVLVPTALLRSSPLTGPAPGRIGLVVFLWFVVVAALAALGVFEESAGGVPALGFALAVPLVGGLIAVRRSEALRQLAFETPLPVLVLVNVGRLLGVFFLLLYARGRLPPTFANSAGWGDIAVAAAAVPLAWALHRRALSSRFALFLWNVIGFTDLVIAVALGIGSAAGSPVRFIFETAETGTLAALPWILIPAFLVPFYLLIHLAIFARLAKEQSRSRRLAAPSLP